MSILERNHPSTGGTVWITPSNIYCPLDDEFNFVFDLACDEINCQCESGFYYPEFDALNLDWPLNGWLWLNPPYRPIRDWIQKAQEQAKRGCKIMMLMPAMGFGNKYFHKWLPTEIRFFVGRVKFEQVGKEELPNTRDSALFIFNGNKKTERPACSWIVQG